MFTSDDQTSDDVNGAISDGDGNCMPSACIEACSDRKSAVHSGMA